MNMWPLSRPTVRRWWVKETIYCWVSTLDVPILLIPTLNWAYHWWDLNGMKSIIGGQTSNYNYTFIHASIVINNYLHAECRFCWQRTRGYHWVEMDWCFCALTKLKWRKFKWNNCKMYHKVQWRGSKNYHNNSILGVRQFWPYSGLSASQSCYVNIYLLLEYNGQVLYTYTHEQSKLAIALLIRYKYKAIQATIKQNTFVIIIRERTHFWARN